MWAGSVHERMFCQLSGIQDLVRRYDSDICLLGDSGYGIIPFDEPRNAHEPNFNLTQAQERVIIERVFCQLKRCFPKLSSQGRIAVKNVPKLVISCAVLHNIA